MKRGMFIVLIWIVAAGRDGFAKTQECPVPSPDGEWIAVTERDRDTSEVLVYRLNKHGTALGTSGDEVRYLTSPQSIDRAAFEGGRLGAASPGSGTAQLGRNFCWLPERSVSRGRHHYCIFLKTTGTGHDLCIADVDTPGGPQIRITNDAKIEIQPAVETVNGNPLFPGYISVAFIKQGDLWIAKIPEDITALFSARVSGAEIQPIEQVQITNSLPHTMFLTPKWHPAGDGLMVTHSSGYTFGLYFIYRDQLLAGMSFENRQFLREGDMHRLVDDPGADELHGSFSPNGNQIAFYSNRHNRQDPTKFKIHIAGYYTCLDPNAGNHDRLLSENDVMVNEVMGPAWSPGGACIVYVKASPSESYPIKVQRIDSPQKDWSFEYRARRAASGVATSSVEVFVFHGELRLAAVQCHPGKTLEQMVEILPFEEQPQDMLQALALRECSYRLRLVEPVVSGPLRAPVITDARLVTMLVGEKRHDCHAVTDVSGPYYVGSYIGAAGSGEFTMEVKGDEYLWRRRVRMNASTTPSIQEVAVGAVIPISVKVTNKYPTREEPFQFGLRDTNGGDVHGPVLTVDTMSSSGEKRDTIDLGIRGLEVWPESLSLRVSRLGFTFQPEAALTIDLIKPVPLLAYDMTCDAERVNVKVSVLNARTREPVADHAVTYKGEGEADWQFLTGNTGEFLVNKKYDFHCKVKGYEPFEQTSMRMLEVPDRRYIIRMKPFRNVHKVYVHGRGGELLSCPELVFETANYTLIMDEETGYYPCVDFMEPMYDRLKVSITHDSLQERHVMPLVQESVRYDGDQCLHLWLNGWKQIPDCCPPDGYVVVLVFAAAPRIGNHSEPLPGVSFDVYEPTRESPGKAWMVLAPGMYAVRKFDRCVLHRSGFVASELKVDDVPPEERSVFRVSMKAEESSGMRHEKDMACTRIQLVTGSGAVPFNRYQVEWSLDQAGKAKTLSDKTGVCRIWHDKDMEAHITALCDSQGDRLSDDLSGSRIVVSEPNGLYAPRLYPGLPDESLLLLCSLAQQSPLASDGDACDKINRIMDSIKTLLPETRVVRMEKEGSIVIGRGAGASQDDLPGRGFTPSEVRWLKTRLGKIGPISIQSGWLYRKQSAGGNSGKTESVYDLAGWAANNALTHKEFTLRRKELAGSGHGCWAEVLLANRWLLRNAWKSVNDLWIDRIGYFFVPDQSEIDCIGALETEMFMPYSQDLQLQKEHRRAKSLFLDTFVTLNEDAHGIVLKIDNETLHRMKKSYSQTVGG
ncbi:PD40 domain-containing protein [bacterium]|nr:PD40 domain-containing protein [candidate division CSSED10-310 bacterium]